MSVIYWGSEPEEVEAGTLQEILSRIEPIDIAVEIDTEASGLFVDGDWKDAPKARVSAVSLAWAEYEHCNACYADAVGMHLHSGGEHHPLCDDTTGLGDGRVEVTKTVALPFDQGRIGGKPGKWSDELNGYATLPHTDTCTAHNIAEEARNPVTPNSVSYWDCVCAPWNLNRDDWEALCEWLTQRRLTMHNMKYDLHIMNAGLRDGSCGGGSNRMSGVNLVDQTTWDTMLAQNIICPLETSSLKPTSERLFGDSSRDEERIVKEALKKNGVGLTHRYDLLAWDVLGPYAAKDTLLTRQLRIWQQEQISSGVVDAETVRQITGGKLGPKKPAGEIPLAKLLFKMECRRFGFNIEGMKEATEDLIDAAKDLAESMPFQPVNVNQAKKYFFETLGITPIKVTDVCTVCTFNREKGQQRKNTKKPLCKSARGSTDPFQGDHTWAPSLDTEVSARLAADDVPFADRWVQLAQIESALSKWYKAWPNKAVKTPEGWRLMTNFRQGRIESDRPGMTSGGAISGRLSAERIQAQGFPDDYKIPSFITPPKKLIQGALRQCPYCDEITQHEVWEVDISNAEVRVAAWLMQSETLANACASGNVHSANCRIMFGIEEDHAEWGMYRKIAKTTILGLFFGAGKVTLRAQVQKATGKDFPMSKILGFIDLTLKVVPELRSVSSRMQRKADKSLGGLGYITLVNGRKRWFGWAERTHKAFNQGTQGGVAEMMKTFMLMIEGRYPGILINQVHDSGWLELCPCRSAEVVADVKAEGEWLFTESFSTDSLRIPFELDTKRLA